MKDTAQILENYLSKTLNQPVTPMLNDTSPKSNKPSQNRQQILQEQLNKARHLASLWLNPDFQNYLLPHLKSHLDNKWLDPLQFPSQEEFYRAYLQYRAKAVAYSELIQFLQSQEAEIKSLEEKLSGKKRTI